MKKHGLSTRSSFKLANECSIEKLIALSDLTTHTMSWISVYSSNKTSLNVYSACNIFYSSVHCCGFTVHNALYTEHNVARSLCSLYLCSVFTVRWCADFICAGWQSTRPMSLVWYLSTIRWKFETKPKFNLTVQCLNFNLKIRYRHFTSKWRVEGRGTHNNITYIKKINKKK